jgi:hypothetical protein
MQSVEKRAAAAPQLYRHEIVVGGGKPLQQPWRLHAPNLSHTIEPTDG